MENLSKSPRLIEMDPWLEQAEGEILARHSRFVSKLNYIEEISANIEQFAAAYEYMGFHFIPAENSWVYREWAPGAHGLFLTGDFNNWNQYAHPLQKKKMAFGSLNSMLHFMNLYSHMEARLKCW